MKRHHHIKLVTGDEHTVIENVPKEKKEITTLTMGLSKKELSKMKSVTGLKGDVTNDQIIKAFIKLQLLYGF
jgi:hypothetical protein